MKRLAALLFLTTLAVAAPALAEAKKKLLYFGVSAGEGFTAKQVSTIDSLVLDALQKDQKIEALGRSDLATMLGAEQTKQALGCDESTSCMAEIAGSAGAELIASGSVGKLGSLILVNLRIMDSAKAKVLSSAKRQVKAEEELPGAVDELVKESLAASRGESVPTPKATPAPTPAPVASPGVNMNGFTITPNLQFGLLFDANASSASFFPIFEARLAWDQFFVSPRLGASTGETASVDALMGVEIGYLFDGEAVVRMVSPGAAIPYVAGMKLYIGGSLGPQLMTVPNGKVDEQGFPDSDLAVAGSAHVLGVLQGEHLMLQLGIGGAIIAGEAQKPVDANLGLGWRF